MKFEMAADSLWGENLTDETELFWRLGMARPNQRLAAMAWV
jgi:hypothetical protein